MGDTRFALEPGGPLRLRLSSDRWFRSTRLYLDERSLGPAIDRRQLQRGLTLNLPDGTQLTAQLLNPFLWPELRLSRNGAPIPGSAADPFEVMKSASRVLYFLGAINVVFGAAGLFTKSKEFGADVLILGVLYSAMAFFTAQGSALALGLGAGLYALDTVLSIGSGFGQAQPPVGALMVRGLLLYGLGRGLLAAWQLRTEPPASGGTEPPLARTEALRADFRPGTAAQRSSTGSGTATHPIRLPAVVREPVQVDAVAAARVGTVLGKWELVSCLGVGGMATVYEARDAEGREAALKVIRSELAVAPEFFERFERECHLASRLDHPSIVKVIEHGRHEGTPYLVMGLLARGTLADLVRRGPMPPRLASRVATQVAAALDEAHRQEIVHRDVKPANVLLDASGAAQLSDFGVARLGDAASSLTRTGLQVGSPQYMSPEQWHGGAVDARADVYSLAVMTYEMLTGHPPYAAESPAVLMRLHLEGAIPSARARRPSLPSAVDDFFQVALAKDPNQRFQSAGALATALERAITVRPTVVRARPGAHARSMPAWAPVALGTIIILALGTLAFVRGRSASGQAAAESPGEPVRRSSEGPLMPPRQAPAIAVAPTPVPTPVPDNGLMPVSTFPLGATIRRLLLTDGSAYVLNGSDSKIHRLDMNGREIVEEAAVAPGTLGMSLSPSGRVLVTCASPGHDAYSTKPESGTIQVLQPEPLSVLQTIAIPFDPFEIAARDDDTAYVSGGSNQHTKLVVVSAERGSIVQSIRGLYQGAFLRRSALGRLYYSDSVHLSPGDVGVLEESTETTDQALLKDSRYHGEHSLGGPFELSPDGRLLVTGKGTALRLSMSTVDDMQFLGRVSPHRAAAFAKQQQLLLLGLGDGRLEVWAYPSLEHRKTYMLPLPAYQLAVDEARGLLVAALDGSPARDRFTRRGDELGVGDLALFDVAAVLR